MNCYVRLAFSKTFATEKGCLRWYNCQVNISVVDISHTVPRKPGSPGSMLVCRLSLIAFALGASSCMQAQQPSNPSAAALDIRAILMQTLTVHPSARAAQQKLLEAQAKVAEAAAQRRLHLTFSGSVSGSYGQVAQPSSTQTFGMVEGTLALPLPNRKRQSAVSAQAEGGVRAAQSGLERVRLDLAFRAGDAYYRVLRTRGARDIAAENLAQAERQVVDTKKRVDAGDLPPSDVLKAQVPLAQTRVTMIRTQTAVRVAEQTLNSLLASDLSAAVVLAPAPTLVPLKITREQVLAQAAIRSPDIREAQANLDTAEATLRVTGHARDPEWTVQATHTRTTDITAYSNLSSVMLSVNLPLGNGSVARQQAKQVLAQIEQARSALALAKQQAQLEAQQSYLEVEAGAANVSGTQETLRISQESLTKARQAYDAGLTTTRDVLDAQLALAQARTEANAAVYDLAVARATLDQAMAKEPLP